MSWRWSTFVVTLLLVSLAPAALAEPIPLASLHPTKVLSYKLGEEASAIGTIPARLPGIQSPQTALVFNSECEVTFAIPSGQSTFSGILLYPPQPRDVPGGNPFNVPVHVRVLTDGNVAWEQVMDGSTPPVEFSLPVRGASVLTITSLTPFLGPSFQLIDAAFGQTAPQSHSTYIPEQNAGYVDYAPLLRQSMARAYHPGENVPLAVAYGGSETQAQVHIRLTPDDGNQVPQESNLSVPLKMVRANVASGTSGWKLPTFLGPAQLEVTETVHGAIVFQRKVRVALIHAVDVKAISDNAFGLQLQTTGFPLLYDELADLWGAKWVRRFMRWSVVEASQGSYDFARMDALVNMYRAQGLRVMLVLGEDAPSWAGYPNSGPYLQAWKQYVAATVRHFNGRVDTWDLFNEVDNKFHNYQGKAAEDWDLAVLRTAAESIRANAPQATIVCCSNGSANWLPYDQRLIAAGVFSDVDIVSTHPYQPTPPEMKHGAFNYEETMAALKNLFLLHRINKPIWGTEANWLIGPAGSRDVLAPDLTEEGQAKNLARVNLLSVALGVKYFIHSPIYTSYHPEPLVPALSAVSEIASLFSGVTQPALMYSGPQLYGITSTSGGGRVGAVWAAFSEATIRLEGGENYRFMDMYGNPITINPESVHLSSAPIYFTASGSEPRIQILKQVNLQWRPLPDPRAWQCHPGTSCISSGNGQLIRSSMSRYGLQLTSPPISVPSNTCLMIRLPITVEKGSLAFAAHDESRHLVDNKKLIIQEIPGGQSQLVELKLNSGATRTMSLIINNANQTDSQSIFTVEGRPQLATCPQ